MTTEREFLEEQLAETEEILRNYNAAIRFLTLNPTESYTLDTGQSQQEVKRHNLDNMQKARSRLMNEYRMLRNSLNTSVNISTPAW
ncbi:MAG: hypothetical protein GY854_16515 [Deltaproteobacteria bacterium]|nr:hypothetical protein [Deltaproteobacteria bacterium]